VVFRAERSEAGFACDVCCTMRPSPACWSLPGTKHGADRVVRHLVSGWASRRVPFTATNPSRRRERALAGFPRRPRTRRCLSPPTLPLAASMSDGGVARHQFSSCRNVPKITCIAIRPNRAGRRRRDREFAFCSDEEAGPICATSRS